MEKCSWFVLVAKIDSRGKGKLKTNNCGRNVKLLKYSLKDYRIR